MYRAVLDTCVLVPDLQRDFLLQLAAEGAYAPIWGTGILVELDYVLRRLDEAHGRPDNAIGRKHLLREMDRAFPGSAVPAPKDGDYDHYQLSDPHDGHVAHAAIVGKADAIATDDTRSGMERSAALRDASVEVVSPHDFAAHAVSAHPEAGRRAVQALADRRRARAMTPQEILFALADRHGMAEVQQLLGE